MPYAIDARRPKLNMAPDMVAIYKMPRSPVNEKGAKFLLGRIAGDRQDNPAFPCAMCYDVRGYPD
jgi:hypothetical protein